MFGQLYIVLINESRNLLNRFEFLFGVGEKDIKQNITIEKMKKRKMFSFNSELDKVTGVQKVLIDIHKAMKNAYVTKIVGNIPYTKINKQHGIKKVEYRRFVNPFMFYNSIVILHERKYLLIFWILNNLFFQRIKLVYIHHNIFNNYRLLSIMPRTVVSISDRCTENLTTFFKVPIERIHKIYNCVIDTHPAPHKYNSSGEITLVYPARVNSVKRQIEVYKNLRGKLNPHVKILFAGIGPEFELLRESIKGNEQFRVLGFIDDIPSLLLEYDYMLLFSKHEGLPITLIEATMCYTPIICNDVGGNTEIAHNGENAFIVNDWEELIQILNSLPKVGLNEYMNMSSKSRSIYEENFTFHEFQKNYLKLFSQL